jgi:Dolichyl-phosphate-mannose-protein mannosyltransferase
MDRFITILCILVAIAYATLAFPDGIVALALAFVLAAAVVFIIRRYAGEEYSHFLIQIFVVALLLRLTFGLSVEIFEMRDFFGEDSRLYDLLGARLAEIWSGSAVVNDVITYRALDKNAPGWGIYYIAGAIYYVVGKNILAAGAFCSVIGAATVPLVYSCAYNIFSNRRVSKVSAFLVAFFPAYTIWSSQLLKDGLIIFLLVLTMTMVLQLQKKFSYLNVAILIFSLFGIFSLRFYIFYMVVIAVGGSFLIGLSGSVKTIVRGLIALVIVGLILTYLGVLRTATSQFERYGNLERIQMSRLDLARSAESGFGEDVDVSTAEGAIAVIPIGFTYLMFAPFPWQISNFRQAITLPEMLVWWACIPFLLSGLWYTIKNRLRNSISILIFSLLLTIAYSIFQGNVGTAYRQRAQIQVFLFIFIAVGWALWQERKENRQLMRRRQN